MNPNETPTTPVTSSSQGDPASSIADESTSTIIKEEEQTFDTNALDRQFEVAQAKRQKFDEMFALALLFKDTVHRIRPKWEEENKDRVSMLFAEMVQEIDEKSKEAVDELTGLFQNLKTDGEDEMAGNS